ncbi:hypothetical protein AC578_7833 [Pseudocercospora eumusae]|uniref:Arabinan endo-1,5-alpha-L-arabinosidase n=1 Tax=Pseudocercospora eumusae TaxID=321146 RepID=A0A139HJ59_9PEZI|nr:hypothetical protein AC578_7833 [Pseudocercospora eumusae]
MAPIAKLLMQLGMVADILVAASPMRLIKRQYPAVGACSGKCQGDVHDPAVIYREDTKTYYRFVSNNKISIATAPSMAGPWTDKGPAVPAGSIIDLPGRDDLWAPDIAHIGDEYLLFYAVSKIGSQNSDIGVATSKTMDPGSWTDHGSIGIPADSRWNRIDPNLFAFDPKNLVLSYGSFWSNIWQVPMSSDGLKVTGAPVHIAMTNEARPNGLTTGDMEGAYEFEWGGFTYLFFSGGNCCNKAWDPNGQLAPKGEEYHVKVCRSSQQSSGFVDQQGRSCLDDNGGTMVLASHDNVYAPGGQGVMYDPNLKSVVMYYHYVQPDQGYAYDKFFFGWSKLDFSSGWPVVVG